MNVSVNTAQGEVRGSFADGVHAFLGVPYAVPPFGAKRLRPPQELARSMHAACVAFATSGDPGWPRYEPGRRATMRFDTTSRVVEDPRTWERALWEGLR